jgi:FAD/FMN-containing dehydrogenase
LRSDNTGYDLTSLFVGAEGTLGVITGLDLRLHPSPPHRVTAVAGFADLDALIATGRQLRDTDGIAALELIDARASALTAEHLGVHAAVGGAWQLLIEMAGAADQSDTLADVLDDAELTGEPAVGVDISAQQRLWQVREAIGEILGWYGPPLKFDVSLPLSAVTRFAAAAAAVTAEHAPEAIPVLFGHIGEGNLHLNLVRCNVSGETERALYTAMMTLIADCGGNVSSEHGVGTRKRDYLTMSRTDADVAAMRTVKAAFDPTGYLNPAVLFR